MITVVLGLLLLSLVVLFLPPVADHFGYARDQDVVRAGESAPSE